MLLTFTYFRISKTSPKYTFALDRPNQPKAAPRAKSEESASHHILNLKRQLRTKTIPEMIFDVLKSIRRVLGDF